MAAPARIPNVRYVTRHCSGARSTAEPYAPASCPAAAPRAAGLAGWPGAAGTGGRPAVVIAKPLSLVHGRPREGRNRYYSSMAPPTARR